MFCKDKESITKVVKIIRKELCAYMGDRCDCKYGYEGKENIMYGSEQTGCPELYTVLSLLHNMTDEEYEAILKRTYNIMI